MQRLELTNACSSFGEIQPNVNPSHQQINCLLTNAAIKAEIPPEVVKAVATQENGDWRQFNDAVNRLNPTMAVSVLCSLPIKVGMTRKSWKMI